MPGTRPNSLTGRRLALWPRGLGRFGLVLLFGGLLLMGAARAEAVVLVGEDGDDLRPWEAVIRPILPPNQGLAVQRMGEPLGMRCSSASLLLAKGEGAARAALQACPQGRVWVLNAPALVLEALRAESGGRLSGVASDPPLERQVAVLESLRPRPRQVAVPYSPAAAGLARNAAQLLSAHGFQPILLPSEPQSQPLRPLREVLGEVQAVLALPDPALYHEGLLKHWLLMTAREGVPMIGGLGPQDVRRGIAAASVQAEEAAVALTAELLPELLGAAPLPAVKGLESSRMVHNPLMLSRLGLRLEERE